MLIGDNFIGNLGRLWTKVRFFLLELFDRFWSLTAALEMMILIIHPIFLVNKLRIMLRSELTIILLRFDEL